MARRLEGGAVYAAGAVQAADSGGPVLFGTGLTRDAINLRYAEGARIAAGSSTGDLFFRVRQDGSLHPVTDDGVPRAEPGDTPVVLGTLLA